jgi:hypothetical protein
LESGASKNKLEEILLTEASWEKDQSTPFLSFLFAEMDSIESNSDDKKSKKRERDSATDEDLDTKKRKTTEDSTSNAVHTTQESPKEPAPTDQDTNGTDDSNSKPMSAAERLAKVKASRAGKAPFGAVSREPGVDKFDAKKSRELSSVSSYSARDSSDDDEAVPLRRNMKRETKGREVIVKSNAKKTAKSRRGDDNEYDDEGGDGEGNGSRQKGRGRPKDKERCVYYPNCNKGEECPFFHPTEECTHFPNCTKGDQCDYVHPPCKFGENCARRPMCPYAHSLASAGRSMMPGFPMSHMGMAMGMPGMMQGPPCRNGFACPKKPHCSFAHPAVACRFGNTCRNGMMCAFSHAAPCRNGAECTMQGCKFAHPAPSPKVDPNAISNLSATLPVTPGKEDNGEQNTADDGAEPVTDGPTVEEV